MKEIQIDDSKKIIYTISDGFVRLYSITAVDLDSCPHTIQFNRWDDYSFRSWYDKSFDDYEKSNKETHIFNRNHPLYIPLLHLLNGDDELIIDDDETSELNKKYMKIYLNKDDIIIDFINDLENDRSFEKFNVFIKNICYDLRSKIDCFNKDTKERLYFFFEEVCDLFDNYHQMTIEEYLLNNNLLTNDEAKKYVKKL